ncbi:cytochrome P450 [Mycena olivaceomarginata]|nr:cytochrome P450 [Mycena olivaceomarginata]
MDTSSISLLWFVMAMELYPTTMRNTQDEINQVFNSDTLPNFTKIQELPYYTALIKEVIRWSPVVPLSVPHYTDTDNQ